MSDVLGCGVTTVMAGLKQEGQIMSQYRQN